MSIFIRKKDDRASAFRGGLILVCKELHSGKSGLY